MLETTMIYAALFLFLLGILRRIFSWISWDIGYLGMSISHGKRIASALKGLLYALGPGLPHTASAIFFDVLLQRRVYRLGFYRWLTHMLIFWGFMPLLIFHALQAFFSYGLLPDYEPTLNPYMFLRNLFMAMLGAGVVMAILRRRREPVLKLTSRPMDWLSLVILAIIVFSGLALEAVKIGSQAEYERMVEEYALFDDDETDAPALAALWQEDYGVVFSPTVAAGDDLLQRGRELNEDSCISCHSPPQSAFVSYSLATLIRPIAPQLDNINAAGLLWALHFYTSLAGLAWLAYGKFLHIFTTPISLACREIASHRELSPEARLNRMALDLDACTHCGACSEFCSVMQVFELLGNRGILPSEKLSLMRSMLSGGLNGRAGLEMLLQGNEVCTRCMRCTEVCPAGIDLQQLWFSLQEELLGQGLETGEVKARNDARATFDMESGKSEPKVLNRFVIEGAIPTTDAVSFTHCYQCMTCSGACPVVFASDDPRDELDLMPHQVMRCLGLGLEDIARSARMTWDCLTCYQCQEACPQGVRVTDILYGLRSKTRQAQFSKGYHQES